MLGGSRAASYAASGFFLREVADVLSSTPSLLRQSQDTVGSPGASQSVPSAVVTPMCPQMLQVKAALCVRCPLNHCDNGRGVSWCFDVAETFSRAASARSIGDMTAKSFCSRFQSASAF